MLLLTGATGSIGSRLLPLLLEQGEEVRCLVREPRRLGARRVDVQIALGDLGEMSDPYLVRQALRGVDTVIHLAASIRDQPPKRIEELNGLATVRLLRAAERSGVESFHFFSALDAAGGAADALLPRQVAGRAGGRSPRRCRRPSSPPRSSTTTATPGSRCCGASPSCRCCRSPARAGAAFQPIWAADVARCVVGALALERGDGERTRATSWPGRRRSPTTRCPTWSAASPGGRGRWCTCRCRFVRAGLIALRNLFGEAVFATWEEAELMEVSMVSERGPADAQALGVEPRRMSDVLEDA